MDDGKTTDDEKPLLPGGRKQKRSPQLLEPLILLCPCVHLEPIVEPLVVVIVVVVVAVVHNLILSWMVTSL